MTVLCCMYVLRVNPPSCHPTSKQSRRNDASKVSFLRLIVAKVLEEMNGWGLCHAKSKYYYCMYRTSIQANVHVLIYHLVELTFRTYEYND